MVMLKGLNDGTIGVYSVISADRSSGSASEAEHKAHTILDFQLRFGYCPTLTGIRLLSVSNFQYHKSSKAGIR